MTALVTGANGFVGSAVVARLVAEGTPVRAAVRRPGTAPRGAVEHLVDDLGPGTDWSAALEGCTSVIHLSARVHVMNESAIDPLAEFRRANAQGTARLATQAAAHGVERLVYLSSIGVNGDATGERAFHALDEAAPVGPYAVSKHEGEQALAAVSADTGLPTCVVRAPLVYGAAAGGHFGSLLRGVARGLPLPLGAIANRRTFCSIDNLVPVLLAGVQDPAAVGAIALAADADALSTPELVRAVAEGLGRPARLLPVPVPALRALGRVTGRSSAIARLTGSLEVSPSSTNPDFAWPIPVRPWEGVAAAAAEWVRSTGRPGLEG